MLPLYKKALTAITLLICSIPAIAQSQKQVRINNQVIAFETDIKKIQQGPGNALQPRLVALHFVNLPGLAEKAQIQSKGFQLLEYTGDHTYTAYLLPGYETAILPANVNGIAIVTASMKVEQTVQDQAAAGATLTILTSFYPGTPEQSIREQAALCQGSILPNAMQAKGLFQVRIPARYLYKLAGYYALKYISRPMENHPLDLDSRAVQGAAILATPISLGGNGLTGAGVVVGHGDNCSGIYHIDEKDRVINYNPSTITSHGVLTNGIIGGDGIMNPAAQGIATDATFISHQFDAVLALHDAMYRSYNMTITNNSYASVVGDCGYAGTYDNLSQVTDQLALDNPEVLDVFAAGNDGRLGCRGYAAGYANVCGGYQASKNGLMVGATYRNLLIGEGSSRGPIKDGRIKPEISSIGLDIICPIPPNTYTFTRGTSLSCPQVSGGAALLTQRYKQLKGGANPPSDLLKAILVNGGGDLGNPGPDFLFGFGFMNLRRSLDILEQGHYTANDIAGSSSPQTFSVTVPANTAQLKVMLYYHDVPAATTSSTQLVNDLDLTVQEPGGTIHYPLILDPSPAGAALNATEGVDHLNNIEQVTINNPAAGTYPVTVAAFSIPSGPQHYVIAYDFVPQGVKLLYPIANTVAAADSSLFIYWDASPETGTFTLEYSTDNGANWNSIAAGIAAGERSYKWIYPGPINANSCKVRLTRGSSADVSGSFTINQQPMATLDAAQCPGSVSINWSAVPGADKYYMLLKQGPHFIKADSVNSATLSYTFRGLDVNTDYFVAVQPSFGGKDGYRSQGLQRRPNTGTCAAETQHGDLAIDELLVPRNARRFTRSELQEHTPITIQVRNQDNIAVSNYTVSYRINTDPWVSYPSFSLAANTTVQPIIDYYDFTAPGIYTITVALHNNDRSDPVSGNDTLIRSVWHIPNNKVNLAGTLNNDFESMPDITLYRDSTGVTADGYWDYNNTNDTGRFRSSIPGSKNVSSSRSISMDVVMNTNTNTNSLTGTFNLSNYDTTADEIRLDFDYEMRGKPLSSDSNRAWIRGNDSAVWIPVLVYDSTIDTAHMHQSGSISLMDYFRANRQNYSAATQIRFGQSDTTLIVDDNYGAGVTIDNVRLYKVEKDIALADIISPVRSYCDAAGFPVTVKLRNGTVQAMSGISVAYSIDGAPAVREIVTGTLAGKDSVLHTFASGAGALSYGIHTIISWIHVSGDDYTGNDTMQRTFVISPAITTYPYLETFETSNGYWYPLGVKSSWAYGVPASAKINKAASGSKVWKTGLTGGYNNGEQSYLYSPCFNTAAMADPMLSFSMAYDIEQCDGLVCDGLFMEYSTDNEASWHTLGTNGTGTNWYSSDKQLWMGQNTTWHVASVVLPKAAQLKLRFSLFADPASSLEGVAIDDIHVFDRLSPIVLLPDTNVVSTAQPVSGTGWNDFMQAGSIFSSILPQGQNLGTVTGLCYPQSPLNDVVRRQYMMPRSFSFKGTAAPATPVAVRLFVTDDEVNRMLQDTSCPACFRSEDIYRTGVSTYKDSNTAYEDGRLNNNNTGIYHYYPYQQVQWVPYDNGYYAQLNVNALSELWLNGGGPTGSLPVNTELITLSAAKTAATTAELKWASVLDTQMQAYTLQRSTDSVHFDDIKKVSALKTVGHTYSETDAPGVSDNTLVYYRVYAQLLNGRSFYSVVRPLSWTKENQLLAVYPNPTSDGLINISWTATPGTTALLQLTDVTGKVMFSAQPVASSWNNMHTLSLAGLSQGMYFMKMNIGDQHYTQKLIFK